MNTVAEEVAHKKMMQSRFGDATKAEEEVMYLGQDAYVPRLVAATVPIVKPTQAIAGQDAIMYRPCYAEKPQSNRPQFQRGSNGGMPVLNTRKEEEPHVFPKSTVTGI